MWTDLEIVSLGNSVTGLQLNAHVSIIWTPCFVCFKETANASWNPIWFRYRVLCCRYLRLERNTVSSPELSPKQQEQQVYFDFLRIVLEILNCMIAKGLRQNPELVYTMLHRQEVFASLQARHCWTALFCLTASLNPKDR